LAFVDDPRKSHTFTLFNLGIPISLNSDDPGKFNNEDSTFDYWLTVISSDWSLKQLKLVALYSINHAICKEGQKELMIKGFNDKWNQWI
jgi:adenosine deaminase